MSKSNWQLWQILLSFTLIITGDLKNVKSQRTLWFTRGNSGFILSACRSNFQETESEN